MELLRRLSVLVVLRLPSLVLLRIDSRLPPLLLVVILSVLEKRREPPAGSLGLLLISKILGGRWQLFGRHSPEQIFGDLERWLGCG